ncbi:MAG: lipoyl(octanoyl) transferase LipB [Bacteroidales bacterium]|nr:lipoyl(octanoyl) transferase LipB [Bacteroidales bacterium]
MEREIIFRDLGNMEYAEAWNYQEELFQEIIDAKLTKTTASNYLLFCEHPHVYTLGKSGSDNNLLLTQKALEEKGATFFRTNRGGDITYHGPGQIVGYPILDLEAFNIGIRKYIELLEESVIQLLERYGIKAGRLEGASGVWLDVGIPSARKICAIGVRSSRFVTMHGFAFNVNTNLDYFSYINPCGFTDKGVTSMQKELGKELDMEVVKIQLKDVILEMLNGA